MSHILPSKLGKTLFKFNVTPFSQVRNTLTHYIYKIKQYQLSISFSVTSSLHNYPTLCRFEKQTRKIVPTIQYCYTITNTEFTFFLISFRHYSMSSISIDIVRLISPLCQVFLWSTTTLFSSLSYKKFSWSMSHIYNYYFSMLLKNSCFSK